MLSNSLPIKLIFIVVSVGQLALAQEKEDYEGESFSIVYESIFQILFQEKTNFDSIQVFWDDLPFIDIDSASSDRSELLDYFEIERQKGRIKSIFADKLTAVFRFGLRGQLKEIKFLPLVPVSEIHREGAIFSLQFKWNKEKLVSLYTGDGCCAPKLRLVYH